MKRRSSPSPCSTHHLELMLWGTLVVSLPFTGHCRCRRWLGLPLGLAWVGLRFSGLGVSREMDERETGGGNEGGMRESDIGVRGRVAKIRSPPFLFFLYLFLLLLLFLFFLFDLCFILNQNRL